MQGSRHSSKPPSRAQATRQASRGSTSSFMSSGALEREEKSAIYPPSKLDHLGRLNPEGTTGQRYRFTQTFTMVYDGKNGAQRKARAHWTLVEDAGRQADLSMAALTAMVKTFRQSLDMGMTLVGPRTFRMVLAKHGITDNILVRRLFLGFSGHGNKIDFRDFVRTFISVANVSVEEKLALLVPLYDSDGGGTMGLSEFTQLIVRSVQGNTGDVGISRVEQERRDAGLMGAPPMDVMALLGEKTLEELEHVWKAIKEVQEAYQTKHGMREPDSHDLFALKEADGVRKEALLAACEQRPTVRDFLALHLQPRQGVATIDSFVDPKLDKPTVMRNFYHRVSEVESAIYKECLTEEFQKSDGPPSPPSPSSPPSFFTEDAKSVSVASPPGTQPIWLERGASSVSEQWNTAALSRRKVGSHTKTVELEKRQHASRLNSLMPRNRSEYFAERVEPKVLHRYLNQSRSEAGLPPFHTSIEHLDLRTRGSSSTLPHYSSAQSL